MVGHFAMDAGDDSDEVDDLAYEFDAIDTFTAASVTCDIEMCQLADASPASADTDGQAVGGAIDGLCQLTDAPVQTRLEASAAEHGMMLPLPSNADMNFPMMQRRVIGLEIKNGLLEQTLEQKSNRIRRLKDEKDEVQKQLSAAQAERDELRHQKGTQQAPQHEELVGVDAPQPGTAMRPEPRSGTERAGTAECDTALQRGGSPEGVSGHAGPEQPESLYSDVIHKLDQIQGDLAKASAQREELRRFIGSAHCSTASAQVQSGAAVPAPGETRKAGDDAHHEVHGGSCARRSHAAGDGGDRRCAALMGDCKELCQVCHHILGKRNAQATVGLAP